MALPVPYIQHGRIFFVPVIPQRLSFAILVWRAFRELEGARKFDTRKDMVAVELPESLKEAIDIALSRLDSKSAGKAGRLSLLYATTPGEDHREVFPVTPCDGIIEGLRSARESGLRVEFVDRELAPGHLAVRSCVEDSKWPDDELALVKGPGWYLDRLQPLLAHPPLRCEPVDTWREAFMTERLRQLAAVHERVLFVCQATHVNPIRSRLRRPAEDLTGILTEPKPDIRIERADPSLGLQLHYLDDFPRLVEIFNRNRADGTAGEFTKRRALLHAIFDLRDNARQASHSIRRFDSFLIMVQRLAMANGRHAPRMEEIVRLAAACFDEIFAEQIRRHLLGYYDHIAVDRVGWLKAGPYPEETGETEERRVFSRGCNPSGRWYDLVPLPVLPTSTEEEQVLAWPLRKKFLANMHRKAFALEEVQKKIRSSSRFQGSIQRGIDVRRTLRSYLGPEPTLYVKYTKRSKRQERQGDMLDPVVWIFETDYRFHPNWDHYSLTIANSNDYSSGYTGIWVCGDEREYLHSIYIGGREIRISRQLVLGAVNFCQAGLTIQKLQEIYGDEMSARIPRFRKVDEKLSGLDMKLVPVANWHDILLEGALSFAIYRILLVCPSRFVISDRILSLANALHKQIDRIPLSRYTAQEQWKMRNDVMLSGPFGIPEGMDRNDPDVTRNLVEMFKHIMKAYW